MKTLILASQSRYRAELLQRLGLIFTSIPSNCDETPLNGEPPASLVTRLAQLKAQTIADSSVDTANALIIGSDQVADLNGTVLGKPGTVARAHEQLASLSGQTVIFRTGLCVLDADTGQHVNDRVDVEVKFRHLDPAEIERYIEQDQPLDCAGSFKSESLGISLLTSFNTEDPTALVGLPLIRLCKHLRQWGLPLP